MLKYSNILKMTGIEYRVMYDDLEGHFMVSNIECLVLIPYDFVFRLTVRFCQV